MLDRIPLPPIPKKLITIGDSRTSVSPTTKDQLAKAKMEADAAKMEADAATNKLYAAEAAHETAKKNNYHHSQICILLDLGFFWYI